jgi:general secretion pathway protein D
LNRLAIAHGPRVVSIATALWLLTTPNVSAQIQMPAGPTAAKPSATTGPATAQQLIGQARMALARKDYQTAVQAFRKVASLPPSDAKFAGEIVTLRKQLEAAGIDAALLKRPPTPISAPTSMQRLPNVPGAAPIATAVGSQRPSLDPASRKKEALRLVAIGRAALDRGDASTALLVAKQAQSLQVAEKDFAPGDPRVWQLILDAESAARRSGIALTSGQQPLGRSPAVQQAVGTTPQNNVTAIEQMLFAADQGPSQQGAVRQVQNEAPLSAASSPAKRMYNDGLDALSRGDRDAARGLFLEAWRNESQLDPATRSQLKDKLTLMQPARTSSKTDAANLTPIQKADLEAQEKTRRLYREVTAELAKANESKVNDPLDTLDQLQRLRRRVDGSDIAENSKRTIAVLVDRAIKDQTLYNEANRAKINLELQNDSVRSQMATDAAREASIDEEVSSLVETFNQLMEERRYSEAEVVAKQVSELKPGAPIAQQMHHNARMGTRLLQAEEVEAMQEDAFHGELASVSERAANYDPDNEITFPEEWGPRSLMRLEYAAGDSRLSAAEQMIERKMTMEVDIKYNDRPLGEVLDDLSATTGVPIVIDTRALTAVRITPDTPVSLSLPNPIALKSALNIILEKMELTHVIENDVLNVTTIEAKRSMVFPKTYRVTDLVTPIPNFTSSYEDGLAGALRAAYQMSAPQTDVHIMPVSMTDLGNGMAKTMSPASMNPNVLGQYNSMGSQGGFGPGSSPMGGAAGGGAFADFQSLIDLIQTTVVPDTWEALGGPSTMAPYPQNLSLVISTTSDVHDQISDLLESLRALQNLQITIEVRFITLSDSFFEQIGVDFNVQFDDNLNSFPEGEDEGPSVTVGLGGDGLPTADLDIRFNNGSFGASPPFGGFDAGSASTIGFAMLSDIEAFFFLQAAQGDNRNNIMQAPKVTLFDGQIATISDVTQRPFVTSITPVVGDFAVAQQPVIVVLNEGTQLNVQGIVSDDKRFVRLTLVPFFSQIGDVDTFTFEGRRTRRSSSRDENGDTNGDGVIDDSDEVDETDELDIIEGTTVQLPTFAFTQVSTTVSVPDGGTILLGGIKRLAEGRSERGVPMLSKIPYVSRLFRNVSVGRDARSLMLMVTPRIIIQEEEELAQTGFDPSR